ncbi:MAG: GAP family protein [Rubrobacteraceae bacterium]|nr:GAP family protein [Rubrobacteraceae bacterium]
MNLTILPLAITMMVGPGIMADVVLITAPRPVKVSAAFVAGVAVATAVGVLVALTAVSLLGNSVPLGRPSHGGSIGNMIQYLLVGLLGAASVKNYVQRATIEPPRWMGALQSADSRRAQHDRGRTRKR